MLSFLQPIWLWASAGIIVPVIIHLWNVKGGKTLKVGSIAFFINSAPAAAKSFRLTDLLLLLLRCLLLITLAMLLAKPFWNEQKTATEKGWLLIEKSEVKIAYNHFKPLIDSLLKQGYAFHYFDESFEKSDLKKMLQTKEDTTNKPSLSYWALLKMANDKVSQNCPVYLFTNNRLQRFEGNRPNVSLHLKWYTYSSQDTAAQWLEKAYQTSADSIRVVEANSHLFGTNYTYQNISLNNANSNYKLSSKEGKIVVTSNDSLHQMIEADTATIIILIYANQFFEDANYVKAAINAIKDFTQYKMKVMMVNDAKNIPPNYNWWFWLSEDAVPVSEVKNNVFIYEKGKPESIHSTMFTDNKNELTTPGNISLYKYIKTDSTSFQALWKNGFGEPLLSKQNGAASVYHFYSRFNPQWNDLVWSHSFPQAMYDLIFYNQNNSDSIAAKDKRMIDSSQIQPVFVSRQNNELNQNQIIENDLSSALWCLAFFLFVMERILSFRIKKQKNE